MRSGRHVKESGITQHERLVSVLFINENPYEANAVCRLCERFGGVLMHPACSAREALRWISLHRADVIVTEFDLPEMNGIDLCQQIRAQGWTIPCILFSSADAATTDAILQDSSVASDGMFWYLKKDGPLRSQIVVLMDLIAQAARKP